MNIIITAPVHQYLKQEFERLGHNLEYRPDITYTELNDSIENAEGLVVTTRIKVDKALLDKATNLKWIGRLGSGLELIDLDAALEKNIACISTPQGNRMAVGEHTLGLLLALSHKIHVAANEVAANLWLRNENRGTEINGKTIGIIGFGNAGSAFAKVLAGFDVTILCLLYTSPSPRD